MVIVSRNNPQVKKILSLKEKKFRRASGLYLVEGIKQVREAVAAGQEPVCVVCSELYAGETFSAEPMRVSDGVFEKLSDEVAPQGILAVLRIPDLAPEPPRGRCLLLDGVADPGNLGTIIRTANAAGYEDIYLLGCTDAYAPKSVRSAMSGLFFVRLHAGTREEIFSALENIPMLCADMGGENIFSYRPPERFCLVIGNEANGVSAEVRARCGCTLGIPMRKSCESLNAGVSAGVLMYLLARRDFE